MVATRIPRLDPNLRRLALGQAPTPVRRLDSLGGRAPVWLKDDGAYGRYAGNKARKLEWLLGEARRRGKRVVLTGGALGTNHGLATALYARELGMTTILVLVPQPLDSHVEAQLERMRASGAELHFAGGTARAFAIAATLLVRRAKPPLRLPYLILPGGSVALGCIGYVDAGLELGSQIAAGDLPEPSHVVVAVGSGGTAAGLLLGMRIAGLRSRLVGVLVNDLTPVSEASIARMARRTQRLLARRGAGLPRVGLSRRNLDLRDEWLGDGYGHATAPASRATEIFAREGLTLDPVYTAKAAAALLELNAGGSFAPGPVLFWHTYKAPA